MALGQGRDKRLWVKGEIDDSGSVAQVSKWYE